MSATPKFPHCWVEGDRLPEIVGTLKDTDLSSFTVTLHLTKKDGTVVIISSVGIDLTQGHFRFPWGVGDLVEGMNQRCEIQFVNASGLPLTSKLFLIDVRGEIA